LAHNNIGHCAAEIGDTRRGRQHAAKALELLHELGDRLGEATAVDTLARIEHQAGHHTEAIALYERALALYRAENDDYMTANSLSNLGHPHVALDQRERAAHVWLEALDLLEQQGRDDEADRMRAQLAELHVPPGS
jgi:tetratricopeptide (TPR) repeat protein